MTRARIEVLLADHDIASRRVSNAIQGLTEDDYYWKPIPEAFTLKDLIPQPQSGISTIEWKLAHLALAKMRYARLLLREAHEKTLGEILACHTMEHMLAYVEQAHETMRRAIDSLSDEVLNEEGPTGWPKPRDSAPILPTLMWRINHDVYHAGQIATVRTLHRALRGRLGG